MTATIPSTIPAIAPADRVVGEDPEAASVGFGWEAVELVTWAEVDCVAAIN
jgi:hypothetical protein